MYYVVKSGSEYEVKPFEEIVKGDEVKAQYEYEWEAEEHADYFNQQAWKRAEDDSQREAWQQRQYS